MADLISGYLNMVRFLNLVKVFKKNTSAFKEKVKENKQKADGKHAYGLQVHFWEVMVKVK